LEHSEVDQIFVRIPFPFGQRHRRRGASGDTRRASTFRNELLHGSRRFFDVARAYEHRLTAQSHVDANPEETFAGHGMAAKISFDKPENPTVASFVEARGLVEEAATCQRRCQIVRTFPLGNPSSLFTIVLAQDIAHGKLAHLVGDVLERPAQSHFTAIYGQHEFLEE
jgi:hypothetical protein